MTSEDQENAYNKVIQDAHQAQAGHLVQLVLAVSGGGIGLSVTFLEKIAGSDPRQLWVLHTSWAVFCVSIACLLSAVSLSVYVLGSIGQLQMDLSLTKEAWLVEHTRISKFKRWISPLNWIAPGTSALGVVLLALFCGINLATHRSKQTMSDSNKPHLMIATHEGPSLRGTFSPPMPPMPSRFQEQQQTAPASPAPPAPTPVEPSNQVSAAVCSSTE